MVDTSPEEVTEDCIQFSDIDELACWLFSLQNPGAVFAAEDEVTRLFWRKEAQRRMQEAIRKSA
jgi:hypothetical protein